MPSVLPFHAYVVGKRIQLSGRRLREQYLPDSSTSYHVLVIVDEVFAGSVLACFWEANGLTIGWVTQLVVHRDYRRRGLASGLLRSICSVGGDVYGIMSSNPIACVAAASAFWQ